MAVERVPKVSGLPYYNSISKKPFQVGNSNPTLMADIDDSQKNLINELTLTRNAGFKDFVEMLTDFQINMFASNILGKDSQFDIKTDWGKITQKFQDVSTKSEINIPIGEAWKIYSINVTELVVRQCGFHSHT